MPKKINPLQALDLHCETNYLASGEIFSQSAHEIWWYKSVYKMSLSRKSLHVATTSRSARPSKLPEDWWTEDTILLHNFIVHVRKCLNNVYAVATG